MRGQRAFGTEGHNYLRLELANAPRQVAANLIETLLIQAAVGIVEHEAAGGVQMFAGGGKFPAAHRGQLIVVARAPAVARRLSGGQADDVGFDSTFSGQQQAAAETAGFVVRMSRHAKQS